MAHGGKKTGAGRRSGFFAKEAENARTLVINRLNKKDPKSRKTHFALITDKAINLAEKGDRYAREWVTVRAYGKVAQPLVGGDKNEEPIKIDISSVLNKFYGTKRGAKE